MSYPQPGWPPPHPAYGGPAPHPWLPYGVAPPPPPFGPFPPATQPDESPEDEYWKTELRENPLGLENMHIRSEPRQQNGNTDTTPSSNTSRMPSSYSRASDYASRNSYPPNTSRASLASSNSQPSMRAANPSHEEGNHDRNRSRDAIAPRAQYPSDKATDVVGTALDRNTTSRQAYVTYQRTPSHSRGGRTSVPVEAGIRYSSASASAAAHAAQMATRSQTLPGASHRRYTTAASSENSVPQARGMQRSKTLPGEMLATSPRRQRLNTESSQRRASERFNYRTPQDDYEESEEETDADEHVSRNWANVRVDKTFNEKESSRDRTYGGSADARRTDTQEYDREEGSERHRTSSNQRSKSYHYTSVEGDYDGYGNEYAYDLPAGSAADYGRDRRRRDGIGKHASSALKPTTYAAPQASRQHRVRHTTYDDYGATELTEEPEDMHSHYAKHGPFESTSRYPKSGQSPSRHRERKWSYRENNYSGSSSGSDTDDETMDRYRPGRRSNSGERKHTIVDIHHGAPRRSSDRNDLLRVGGFEDPSTASRGKVHLPSPRSLRQSSRTPSARTSYEFVSNEREREHERSKVTNGHLMPGVSSASGAAAARIHEYKTPPVTPTRQEETRQTDSARRIYASQPTSSASAVASVPTSAEHGQTSCRLGYLYRGTSASPSPASGKAASTRPSQQSHTHSSQQAQVQSSATLYSSAGYPEAQTKKRSPHSSRSPSPLPPRQKTSSSSAYYATLGQSNASGLSRMQSRSQGHSHGHGHSHSSTRGAEVAYESHRTEAVAENGYFSSSAAAIAGPSRHGAEAGGNSKRHVRAGYWNRRGDHLTDTGYIVYCPPGRCYPRDLANYPDNAFKDHLGNVVSKTPDSYPELPESIPRSAGRAPERSYDSFVKYVLISS